MEIVNKKSKTIILHLAYRSPNEESMEFEGLVKKVSSVNDVLKKEFIMAGEEILIFIFLMFTNMPRFKA